MSGWVNLATHMGGIDILLNLTVVTLAAMLAMILIVRKIYYQYPYFAIYIGSSIVFEIGRLFVFSQYQAYFKVYWSTEAFYAAIALLVLHEVFRRVFAVFYVDLWFKLLFPLVVILALMITLWAALHNPSTQVTQMIRLVLFFGLAVSFMQLCLVSLLIFLADTFAFKRACRRPPWPSFPA